MPDNVAGYASPCAASAPCTIEIFSASVMRSKTARTRSATGRVEPRHGHGPDGAAGSVRSVRTGSARTLVHDAAVSASATATAAPPARLTAPARRRPVAPRRRHAAKVRIIVPPEPS
jgi:hypothetical protein